MDKRLLLGDTLDYFSSFGNLKPVWVRFHLIFDIVKFFERTKKHDMLLGGGSPTSQILSDLNLIGGKFK